MSRERELLKRAYTAFLNIAEEPSNADEVCAVMGKIKNKLAKPLPEPAAYVYIYSADGNTQNYFGIDKPLFKDDLLIKIEPLYTSPPMREPLSDDEIAAILDSLDFKSMVTHGDIFYLLARAIEKEIRGGQ